MKWKLFVPVLAPVFFVGCSLIMNLSPYAARPICPPPGAQPDSSKKLTPQEMEDRHLVTEECFYRLEITRVDEPSAGRASGKTPRSEIERMKKESDGIDFKDLARRTLKVENYPTHEYNFAVKGGTSGLRKGQVAYFVLEPGNDMLTYYTDEQMCAKKEEMIKEHRRKFYPDTKLEDMIDDDMKKGCPTLASPR